MRRLLRLLALLVLSFAALLSCSDSTDLGSNSAPATPAPPLPPLSNLDNATATAAELFGLRVGAKWTYLRSGGTLRWKEITACEDVPIVDGDTGRLSVVRAYVRENRSELGVTSVHYLTADPTGVHRVRRDDIDGTFATGRGLTIVATYKPPGPRLLNGPFPAGEIRTFELRTFEFEAWRGFNQASSPRGFSDTSAVDTVLGAEDLVVFAGAVPTIGIERQWAANNAHNVVSHYSAGIGEVRERTIWPELPRPRIQIEELVSFTPGYGTCDPTLVAPADPALPVEPPLVVCADPWGTGVRGPTDPRVDPDNCGRCGTRCPSGVCSDRLCVLPAAGCAPDCPGSTLCCSSAWGTGQLGCTSPNRDVFNCGGCGLQCDPPLICDHGACVCPPGQAVCTPGGGCVDILTDPRNCGACGHPCPGNTSCNAGICGTCVSVDLIACDEDQAVRCIDPQWDDKHCGGCGMACGKGTGTTACEYGECVSCEEAGQADCEGNCADLDWSDKHCGECGNACAEEQVCVLGACIGGDGSCEALCEQKDQICCNGECIDPKSSDTNCGGCGVASCTRGCTEACRDGACVPVDCGGGDD